MLKTVSWAPLHGYGIANRIEDVSGNVFKVNGSEIQPRWDPAEVNATVSGRGSHTVVWWGQRGVLGAVLAAPDGALRPRDAALGNTLASGGQPNEAEHGVSGRRRAG